MTDTLTCSLTHDADATILHPVGTLTTQSSVALRDGCAKAVTEEARLILIDLTALRLGDEIALTVLPAMARYATVAGDAVVMLFGATPSLAEMLDRLAICRYVPLHPTREEALAAHRATPVARRLHRYLPPEPSALRAARALVDEACRVWNAANAADHAALLVTELVANAVQHARTEIELSVALRLHHIHIAVRDRSPVLPRIVTPHDTGGRGLLLVEGIAAAWGSNPTPTGKVVWATLPAGPAAVPYRR